MDLKYSLHGLLPKSDTEVSSFLKKHPGFDGRGIRIAILDTGVDPGAAGMQVTTTGERKIVDIIDTTGSGDVDTKTIVTPDENGCIVGLTGRKLKIPDSWSCPSKELHIGLKSLYQLFPASLIKRLKEETKEANWDCHHKLNSAVALKKLREHETKFPQSVPQEEELKRDELASQVDVLSSFEKNWSDLGPTCDCIVFNDGSSWRACVDTSLCGNLEACDVITDYRDEYQYSTFSKNSMLNFSVNIHENGNLLSIVANTGSHGTHVAAIAAANFPDNPEKNGVAPGAQIVAIKIGDTRVGTMETGTSLIRGISEVIKRKCHVINLSYGEATHIPDSGKICAAIDTAVKRHNIIFVSSVGNNGPCLSTLGAPGGTNKTSIGVGAWVTAEMAKEQYSIQADVQSNQYTWSSRGPCVNGALGVTISAPGGAITSVPNWTLQGSVLMNGTSMSSPYACGAVALLLSGLDQRKIACYPSFMKRALERTALKQDNVEVFAQGNGVVQVERAFEYLTKMESDNVYNKIDFAISTTNCSQGEQMHHTIAFHPTSVANHSPLKLAILGIYFRLANETCKPQAVNVTVKPELPTWCDAQTKIELNMHLVLCTKVSWIQAPNHLELMNMARSFDVLVKMDNLEPGVHYTEIEAFDANNPYQGSLFKIPITVIKPIRILEDDQYTYSVFKERFLPGKISRKFVSVPSGSTWAELEITCHSCDKANKFVIHCVQLQPNKSFKVLESCKYVSLSQDATTSTVFAVKEDTTLELCVSQWWASSGTVVASYKLSFHGIKPSSEQIIMHSGDGVHQFTTQSLRKEDTSPTACLQHLVVQIPYGDCTIEPLSSRDILPGNRPLYSMISSYTIALPNKTEVTPFHPLLSDILYENEFNSQLWMMYDTNKQLVCCGDAFPKQYSKKLEKGTYKIRFEVTHESVEILQRVKEIPFCCKLKLSNSINLEIFSSLKNALTFTDKISNKLMKPKQITNFYISPLAADKVPKKTLGGQYLLGSMKFSKNEAVKKLENLQIKYMLHDTSKPKNGSPNDAKKLITEAVMLEEERDLKISWISRKAKPYLYDELKIEWPDHIPLHIAKLKSLDEGKTKEDLMLKVEISNCILQRIDTNTVLAKTAIKSESKEKKCNVWEDQKNWLITALLAKGCALSDLIMLNKQGSQENIQIEENTTENILPSETPSSALPLSQNDQLCIEHLDVTESNRTKTNVSSTLIPWKPQGPVIQAQANGGEQIDIIQSKTPVQDETTVSLHEVNTQLKMFLGPWDVKMLEFTYKQSMALGFYGRALKATSKMQENNNSNANNIKAIAAAEALGWNYITDYLKSDALVKYPPNYLRF